MQDITHLIDPVQSIIRQAGDILLDFYKNGFEEHDKKAFGDLVTQADLASEKFLIEKLSELFPEAGIFAEESGQKNADAEFSWVIDPLDGTANFAHGLSYFCISIALTYKNQPVLGCVYRPIGDELFCAIKGQGATLNGASLSVSSTKDIERAFIGCCLPYGRDERFEHAIKIFERVASRSYGIRKLGAAALDQAYAAMGKLDAVLFEGLGWWDVAAGLLLVQEAGGKVADYTGKPIGPDYRTFIATNGFIMKDMLNLVKGAGTGEDI